MRNILSEDFNWVEFFEKIDSFAPDRLDKIQEAKQAATEIEPEAFGELSDLVAKFRIYVLSGHYIHASNTFIKIREYYGANSEI